MIGAEKDPVRRFVNLTSTDKKNIDRVWRHDAHFIRPRLRIVLPLRHRCSHHRMVKSRAGTSMIGVPMNSFTCTLLCSDRDRSTRRGVVYPEGEFDEER